MSRCLLGDVCRYDGKTKANSQVLEYLQKEGYEVIPFCPEDPLFGTPRERIDVVKVKNELRIVTHTTKKDVTQLLHDWIIDFIQKNPSAQRIILKSKSPSCGISTTPILDQKKNIIAYGSGIGARLLMQYYPKSCISDEHL